MKNYFQNDKDLGRLANLKARDNEKEKYQKTSKNLLYNFKTYQQGPIEWKNYI